MIFTANEPFASILLLSKLDWFRHKWIWEKDRGVNFLQANCMPIKNIEDVLVFNKTTYSNALKENRPTYNPIMVKSDKFQSKNDNKLPFKTIHKRNKYTLLSSGEDYNSWSRYPKSVIYFPVDYGKNRFHPTQKPVELMSYLIRTYTNKDEIVLDNVMGSGSTLVAAQNQQRKSIGIEISEEYCKIAVERLKEKKLFQIPEIKENKKESLF